MNDTGSAKQNLVFIIILLVVGGVVMLYFLMREPDGSGALVESENGATAGQYRDVVSAIKRINELPVDSSTGAVSLNADIFSDAQFRALRDGSVPIQLVTPLINRNPFLPF